MLRRLTSDAWCGAAKLCRSLRQDLDRARAERMDSAHQATRGDRPFMGCRPDDPHSAVGARRHAVNPPAVRRQP